MSTVPPVRSSIAAAIAAAALALAGNVQAGNIALTGHDDDLHFSAGNAAAAQLNAMVGFARSGAADPSKPVLTFDSGTQLTNALTSLGISFTNVNPSTGVASSLFNPSLYSAFVVASDQSCGGCDNNSTGSANLAAQAAAIASFFNAGGGIVALAGASNLSYYSFLPASASSFGNPPSSGYVQTAEGAALGIPAVNGNPTHNFFVEPGTGGVSSAYLVVERLGSATTGTAETIACRGCGISDGGIITPPPGGGVGVVPEPETYALMAAGLALLGFQARRRKQKQ